MDEWYELKKMAFDRCTITIYRSAWAMRKWMVEANYKDGQIPSQLVFENEGDAWRRFYDAAEIALKWDAEPWTREREK